MIVVKNISKKFNNVFALNDLSFYVNDGELFGLIGPDGAGKSTLFRILTTLLLPDSGIAFINQYDVIKNYREIRKIVGYMPGRFSLYQDLSVEENLNFFASVFGTTVEQNYEIIKNVYEQLRPFSNRRAGALSGGMKQKLALCCALIHKPEVLLLDEPTTGVDPVSRKEFWDILKEIQSSGITILVSTPFMNEAELCDRIALINKGKIMLIDSPQGIRRSFSKKLFAVKTNKGKFELLNALKSNPSANSVYPFGEYVHYTDKTDFNVIVELKNYLETNNHSDVEIEEIQAGIEDKFIELMSEDEK